MEFHSFYRDGYYGFSYCWIVLLREVYDFDRDLRDSHFGWDLLCAVSMCIITTLAFSLVVCCVIDKAVPWKDSQLKVEEGL